MAYASRSGRARTSASAPSAHAICDRCGFRYNLTTLRFQYDWRGAALQNLYFLVCPKCYDTPQEQLRAIVVPADPVPVLNPRVQDFTTAETNYSGIAAPLVVDFWTGIPIPGANILATQDNQTSTNQQVGTPLGLDLSATMPLNGTTQYGVALPVLSITADGTDTVTVTCSAAHGQTSGNQVAVEGTSNNAASGFFTITVPTATAFTYRTSPVSIPAGALLTATTRIWTTLVGLPLGFTDVPQTGI